MKINFQFHKNKKLKNLAHFSYTNINPERDWYIFLSVFLIANILGVIFSAYLFFMASHHNFDEGTAPTINQNDIGISRLHKVVSEYDARKELYDKALSGDSTSTDPSI